jgi:hypothetical protein
MFDRIEQAWKERLKETPKEPSETTKAELGNHESEEEAS